MTNDAQRGGNSSFWSLLLTDRLKEEAVGLAAALGERAHSRLGSAADRLTDYAENGGGSGLGAALTGAKQLAEGKSPAKAVMSGGLAALKTGVGGMLSSSGGGGKSGGGSMKVTNIVESIDVGVPVRLAYDQWTQFSDYPSFMKKVESVDQEEDERLNWRAQIFFSHRSWKSTITKQTPDELIIWRSEGAKGHVDGAVTFHPLAPNLTRILVVLEYHPQGFFEQTANIWRAQGRRARLELKHFRRHLMSHVLQEPDELEGWRGVIEDGEVVKDHETAVREEQESRSEGQGSESGRGDRDTDEFDQGRDDDQQDEDEDDERDRDEYDEYDDEEVDDDHDGDRDRDEYDEDEGDDRDEYDEDRDEAGEDDDRDSSGNGSRRPVRSRREKARARR